MSRYAVECPTYLHGEAVVGWDRRRQTYFCHCFDLDHHVGPEEADGPEYSVGTEAGEIPTVAVLLARTFSYTVIDDATVAALLDDPRREAAGGEPRQLVPQG